MMDQKRISAMVIGQIIIFSIILSIASMFSFAHSANAQNDLEMQELKTSIDELQEKYRELRAQVANGEITREEAVNTWQILVDDLYEKKTEIFDQKIQDLLEEHAILKSEDHELAHELKERVNSLEQWRKDQSDEYEKICRESNVIEEKNIVTEKVEGLAGGYRKSGEVPKKDGDKERGRESELQHCMPQEEGSTCVHF